MSEFGRGVVLFTCGVIMAAVWLVLPAIEDAINRNTTAIEAASVAEVAAIEASACGCEP